MTYPAVGLRIGNDILAIDGEKQRDKLLIFLKKYSESQI